MLRKLGIFFLAIGIAKIAFSLIKGVEIKIGAEVTDEDEDCESP